MTDYTYNGTLIVYDDEGWTDSEQRRICQLAQIFLDHYSVSTQGLYVSNERDGFHISGTRRGFIQERGKFELKPRPGMSNGKLEAILLSESGKKQTAKIKINRTVYLVDL